MLEIALLVGGAVVGFIIGVLVYRNNVTLLEEAVLRSEDIIQDLEYEVQRLKTKLRE